MMYRGNDKMAKASCSASNPTAEQAIKNIQAVEIIQSDRYHNLMDTLTYIIDLAGFEIEGELKLKDTRTNRVWRHNNE